MVRKRWRRVAPYFYTVWPLFCIIPHLARTTYRDADSLCRSLFLRPPTAAPRPVISRKLFFSSLSCALEIPKLTKRFVVSTTDDERQSKSQGPGPRRGPPRIRLYVSRKNSLYSSLFYKIIDERYLVHKISHLRGEFSFVDTIPYNIGVRTIQRASRWW